VAGLCTRIATDFPAGLQNHGGRAFAGAIKMQTIAADVHQTPGRMKSQPVTMTLYPFIDGSGANESDKKTQEASQ
jgi:hypothetical protein